MCDKGSMESAECKDNLTVPLLTHITKEHTHTHTRATGQIAIFNKWQLVTKRTFFMYTVCGSVCDCIQQTESCFSCYPASLSAHTHTLLSVKRL